jgi:hypothetical protein
MKNFDRLVFRLFDELLSENDKKTLLKRLSESRKARNRYRVLVALESLLCNPLVREGVLQ